MLFSSPSSMAAYITCGSGPLKSQVGHFQQEPSIADSHNPIERQTANADLEGDAGADLPVMTKMSMRVSKTFTGVDAQSRKPAAMFLGGLGSDCRTDAHSGALEHLILSRGGYTKPFWRSDSGTMVGSAAAADCA